jgi:FkbM family methyltransferase
LKVLNQAFSETAGTIDSYVNEQQDAWGTADPEWNQRFERLGTVSRIIKVRASTMKEILAEFGVPYYMKIDIEGYDHLCLLGLDDISGKPKHVSIEANATSLQAAIAQLQILKRLGYTKFKMILQNDVRKQKCPTPAREGVYVNYQFGSGTSGLFGEELPGTWLNFEEVIAAYKYFYWKVGMIGAHTGVFRHIKNELFKRILGRLFHPGGGWYDTHATY